MPTDNYLDFELLIYPRDAGYQAHVVKSPVGDASVRFALPFSAEELARFGWLSGRATRGMRPNESTPAAPLTVQEFGLRLYEAAFAGEVGQCLVRSLDKAGGQGLRIRLRLDQAPELAELPWEYLYATGAYEGFLALSADTPIVRYLDIAQGAAALAVHPPLRVLAVVADPQDVPKLAVEHEWELLHDALDDVQSRGLVKLERLPQPTLSALQRRLREKDQDVHILHFIGHGAFDAGRAQGGLYFEDEQRRHVFVPADNFAMLLRDHDPLRMVFLNACEGARGSKENLFAGVAQTLEKTAIPAVLAMQFPVGDKAAIALAHEFYLTLSGGLPVDAAVGEARKAVKAAGNDLEWGTPVLFSRSADNRILLLPEGDARLTIERQEWEPETMLIPGGPFIMGRAPGEGVPAAETPAHESRLPDFRMGKYPVTQTQFAAYVRDANAVTWGTSEAAREAGWFNLAPPKEKLDHPVTGVSWHDAAAYCAWLSAKTGRRYRLPSEAEWEKAASWCASACGDEPVKRSYPWGDRWETGRCNANSASTLPVTAHADGASAYGCYDLLGNVQEWTLSLWGSLPQPPEYGYPYDADDGRESGRSGKLPAQARLVHRGGSYKSQPGDLRCTARGNATPDSRLAWRGFRIMMEIA